MSRLPQESLDLLFTHARSQNAWRPISVEDHLLHEIYELTKMGPTAANGCPLRIIFVKSPSAKEKLLPFIHEGNKEKTKTAPITAIFAYDKAFHTKLPFLFPHLNARSWFEGNVPLIEETAFRNGCLQTAYFMLAARALGLDCGPMSGFDKEGVTKEFLADTSFYADYLCNIGYGDPHAVYPRSPRFSFDEVCSIT